MNQILSIIIPCYSEEKSLPILLDKLSRIDKSIEIVLVDNGSLDNSKAVFQKLLPKYPMFKLVSIKKNIGYGNGILEGLKAAKGQFLGWTHADLQTDPADAVRALVIIKKTGFRKDIFIKGWRKGRPLPDRVFSAFMGFYVSLALGKIFKEINAQPTIFSRQFYNSFKNPPKDFSLDLYVYYLAKLTKQKIIRLDVLFPKRLHGQSSWSTSLKSRVKLTLRAMRYTKELKKILHDIRRP